MDSNIQAEIWNYHVHHKIGVEFRVIAGRLLLLKAAYDLICTVQAGSINASIL